MRPLLALLLLVACVEERPAQSPETDDHEEVYQAELRREQRARAHHSTDPSTFGPQPSPIARADAPAPKYSRDARRSAPSPTPEDEAFELAFEKESERRMRTEQCGAEAPARQARIAELEPGVTKLRAEREERERTRASDTEWVMARCYWDNDPRTVYRLERAPRSGQPNTYEFVDRHAGFRASFPKCPKSATKNQWRVAAEIGSRVVDRNGAAALANVARDVEDEQAHVAEFTKLQRAEAECRALGETPPAEASK